MRIGHGYDVHRFCEGNHVMLGGVKVPSDFGVEAHSDGDVLLHALCDALLGAAALGDIGRHFPDTDDAYANADSRGLLRHVISLVSAEGFQFGNADLTLVAQAPRISDYIDSMRSCIAEDIGVDVSQINVKATTTEKLGPMGRKEGIAAHAVVLLEGTVDQAVF